VEGFEKYTTSKTEINAGKSSSHQSLKRTRTPELIIVLSTFI